jgi:hypothetical protein
MTTWKSIGNTLAVEFPAFWRCHNRQQSGTIVLATTALSYSLIITRSKRTTAFIVSLTAFFHLSLLLLAFGLSERSLGPHSDRLSSFLALLALLPVVIHLIWGRDWKRPRNAALLVVAFAGIATWFAVPGPAGLFALAASWAWLAVALQRAYSDRAPGAGMLAVASFGYAVFVAVRDHLTLWPFLSTASEKFSVLVSTGLGDPVRLGPTYTGIWLGCAFTIAMVVYAAVTPRVKASVMVLSFILLVLALPAALALSSLAPVHSHGLDPRVMLGWRGVQFILLLIPLAVLTLSPRGSSSSGTRKPSHSIKRAAGWAAAGVAFIGLALLTWTSGVEPRASRVLLDTRGSFDMAPLEWGKYGPEATQGASLASLPPTLDALGFGFATTDTIEAPLLQNHDVLMIMNPTQVYTASEHRAIWDFVSDGGGLLVLGDHTDIMGTMKPLNSLLEPSGIRINFDSAIPMVDRWTWYGCMRQHPHPLLRGVRNESEIKTSVGASLDLPADAVPILGGRDAFSDAGDVLNAAGAFLGDMSYNRGERLGDLFLAAEAPYGRGKVLVFGDTSTFQRSSLAYTHELTARIFTYLGSPGSAVAPRPLRIAGAWLLFVCAVLLVLLIPRRPLVFALVSTVAALWLLGLERTAVVHLDDAPTRSKVALIDLAHGNRVDIHAGRDDGIAGLINHLSRQGFVPLATRRLDEQQLSSAKLFVSVAPAFPYGPGEKAALRRFVENGGVLIVASGFEELNGARGLLTEFGYSISPVPIGSAHEVRVLLEGHGVFMHESWPVVFPEGRGEVWVECWDYPLVVHERIGKGGLIVIGDSRFLCDVKLESAETFMEPNINFLRAAIEQAQAAAKGAP